MTQHMKALSSTYSGGLGTMPSPTVAGPATPSATSVPVSSPLGPSVQVPGTQTALSYSRPLRPPPPSLSSFEESTSTVKIGWNVTNGYQATKEQGGTHHHCCAIIGKK